MKKQLGLILIIVILLGLPIQTIPPVKSVFFGDVAELAVSLKGEGPGEYEEFGRYTIVIVGETTNFWMVDLLLSGLELPFDVNFPIRIPKERGANGFTPFESAGYWGVWIDPSGPAGAQEVTVNGDILFIPTLDPTLSSFLTVEGSLFVVSSGTIGAYDVWALESATKPCNLYYDKTTGFLVRASYLLMDTSFRIDLVNFIPYSTSFPSPPSPTGDYGGFFAKEWLGLKVWAWFTIGAGVLGIVVVTVVIVSSVIGKRKKGSRAKRRKPKKSRKR